MKKQIIISAMGAILLASCADEFDHNYEVGRPDRIAEYAYLNDYQPLKEYVTNDNFKLGIGTTVNDYLKKELVYALVNSNFTETVAGNAMKMGSIVKDNGDMDFGTVTDYVNTATDAGLNVYGHTLAWHAQQPAKWLNGLIADRQIKVDPNAMELVPVHECDYSKHSDYPWYRMSELPQVVDGILTIDNPVAHAGWEVQYFVDDQVATTKGEDYVIRVTIKGSSDGALKCNVGDWGGQASALVNFSTEWQTVDVKVSAVPAASSFVVFQSGDFVGKIEIKKVEVLKPEAPALAVIESLIHECDYSKHSDYPWYRMSDLPQVVNGVLTIDNPTAQSDWQVQYFVDDQVPVEVGEDYVIRTTIRGSQEGSIKVNVGDWGGQASARVQVTTDWQTVDSKVSAVPAASSFVVFQSGDYVGKLEIKKVQVIKQKPSNVIPLTDEEKKDTLTWAMDKWISGMMEACDGKVKAWDVVNEAISGGDTDGDGKYDLQHESDNANDFFWQNYLGDLDYVRTAVKLARQYGPKDVKLFINDYNLESDWDNNGKLKSLIQWIKDWEADGVTQIDGIGTQMHISYYLDPKTQESKQKALENSFRLMAETGKLVRISELDMGLVDENGNDVATALVTEEQHKAMAAYYTWIIKTYLSVVPAAQQWGITQWCATDSPADSGWRANSPVGLWDKDYYRKHTYAGFADGLSGK